VIGKGNGRGGMVYCTFSRMLGTIGVCLIRSIDGSMVDFYIGSFS
jgi:hypothetical protein